MFRASDNGSNAKIRVSYDTGIDAFRIYTGADAIPDATVSGALDNRWYSIEVNFSNASPVEFRYSIQGAGSNIPIANNLVVSSGISGTDVIDQAEIGWIGNQAGAPTGEIVVDGFDSQRMGAIGRVCRGDADNNFALGVNDRTAIRNEILGTQLASGQPDCTEDGVVDVRDRACHAKRMAQLESCP